MRGILPDLGTLVLSSRTFGLNTLGKAANFPVLCVQSRIELFHLLFSRSRVAHAFISAMHEPAYTADTAAYQSAFYGVFDKQADTCTYDGATNFAYDTFRSATSQRCIEFARAFIFFVIIVAHMGSLFLCGLFPTAIIAAAKTGVLRIIINVL